MATILVCSATLQSMAPLQYSKPITSKKDASESHDAFEGRTWRERMHVDPNGQCVIPAMAVKLALAATAQFLGETVPGGKRSTWTKHFAAGVMALQPMLLTDWDDKPILGKSVEGLRLFVPSDGKQGGGSRVWKVFPVIPSWKTVAEIHLIDQKLIEKPEKVKEYLERAGILNGFGAFSPRAGKGRGHFGRFSVTKFTTSKL